MPSTERTIMYVVITMSNRTLETNINTTNGQQCVATDVFNYHLPARQAHGLREKRQNRLHYNSFWQQEMACSFPYQLGKDLLLLDRRKT